VVVKVSSKFAASRMTSLQGSLLVEKQLLLGHFSVIAGSA
jgi:hypothetical protein